MTLHDTEPGERTTMSPEDISKSCSIYSPNKHKAQLLEVTVKLNKKLKTAKNTAKNLNTLDTFGNVAPKRPLNRMQITSYVKDSQDQARVEQQERSLSRQKQRFSAPNELNAPLRVAPDYQFLTRCKPVAASAPAPAPVPAQGRMLTIYDPNKSQESK